MLKLRIKSKKFMLKRSHYDEQNGDVAVKIDFFLPLKPKVSMITLSMVAFNYLLCLFKLSLDMFKIIFSLFSLFKICMFISIDMVFNTSF